MMTMGLGGAPGAAIYAMAQKSENSAAKSIGFLLCALGQTFVVGAYAAFLVGLLWWFTFSNPDIPTWPLWIAAFFHAVAVPTYGMKEQPEEPTAQHLSLGLVSTLSFILFFLIVFLPKAMSLIYGWVPFYWIPGN
jgi:hypothetical protein